MKKPEKTWVKNYKGSHAGASRIFKKDAIRVAKRGYYPVSQNFHAGSWGFVNFFMALMLFFLIIGALILIYMLLVPPKGILTVTYEYKEKEVEKECPECAEMIKNAAKICRFCRYEFNSDEEGKSIGHRTWWYENGQKKQVANYKNDKRDGLDTLWYENGQNKRVSNYKNDKREGLTTWWHENGQKKKVANYMNGELVE